MDDFSDVIRGAMDSGDSRVQLDFSGISFLSSGMIDRLLQLLESGKQIVIINASANIRETFKICDLIERFEFRDE